LTGFDWLTSYQENFESNQKNLEIKVNFSQKIIFFYSSFKKVIYFVGVSGQASQTRIGLSGFEK